MIRQQLAFAAGIAAALGGAPLCAQDDYETAQIADGVYQFRWIGHNGMFVTTDEGVVVFDPINVDAARVFASEIQRIAPGSPLVSIVYSHSDADHSTGANALMTAMGQEGVPIIAHENAVAPIRARGSADQPVPNVTFSDKLRFEIGGRWIELYYLGPSHTDNMAVPFIPDVGVAFAVDFVSLDAMGYQELPGWQFPEFFDAVSGLLDIPFETMVFGHGPRTTGRPGGDPATDRILRRPHRRRADRGRGWPHGRPGRPAHPSRSIRRLGSLRRLFPDERASGVSVGRRRGPVAAGHARPAPSRSRIHAVW